MHFKSCVGTASFSTVVLAIRHGLSFSYGKMHTYFRLLLLVPTLHSLRKPPQPVLLMFCFDPTFCYLHSSHHSICPHSQNACKQKHSHCMLTILADPGQLISSPPHPDRVPGRHVLIICMPPSWLGSALN
jgi:hypothetical protein